jgi:hypothetical protein
MMRRAKHQAFVAERDMGRQTRKDSRLDVRDGTNAACTS